LIFHVLLSYLTTTGGGMPADGQGWLAMKLRSPALIRLLGLILSWLFRWWMGTVSLRLRYEEREHPADYRKDRFLYVFWHETLLVPCAARAPAHMLISEHADGELITQVCRHLRIGVVRGSGTRRGPKAVLGMIRASEQTHLCITPDGPRGPRRQVKLGTIFLASHTGLPIVPVGVGMSRAWRARSWDRFAVPVPWSAAVCLFAPAIKVPPNLDRDQLEHYKRVVEAEMLRVTEKAEQLAFRSAVKGKAVAEQAVAQRSAA
jgi:lysophospholipid acyltransferase (LPLAT)-like uncharacterized protein